MLNDVAHDSEFRVPMIVSQDQDRAYIYQDRAHTCLVHGGNTISPTETGGLNCRLLSGVYEGLKGSGNQINRAHTVLTLQKSPF